MIETQKMVISEVEDYHYVAEKLLPLIRSYPVVLLYGSLGAGKTSLVKAIGAALGITETIDSPTFPIVQEYTCSSGSIYHFDLYRLNTSEELIEIGFEQYLQSSSTIFIEWPKVALPFLDEYLKISIQVSENDLRTLNYSIISS